MSAICGIVRFDGQPVDSSELETMVESSPYRGPDATGYHIHKNAGFAHMAFHVTPESMHERQPLISEDGRLVLVADVRLDNRDELFRKLEITRDPDRVITDPELILLGWRKWDKACVEHFLGDFVFSIWDSKTETLFLARDSLGAYCVHYHQSSGRFVFASEISAILDLPYVEASINQERVLRELEFLPRNHEDTFFESVYYLPPAHCLLISADKRKLWKYWDINPEHRISYQDDSEYADQLLELIDQSISCRLRSVDQVGISLSGGYDSTLLAARTANNLRASSPHLRLKSFSYVFDKLPECDEREFIEPVVEQYGIDATYLNADQLWTFSNLSEQTIRRDYLWTNCFSQLPVAVAESAQNSDCRILMDGQFGDPLFSGANLVVADLLKQRKFTELTHYLHGNSDQIHWRDDVFSHGIRPLLPAWLRTVYRSIKPSPNSRLIEGYSERKMELLKQIKTEPNTVSIMDGQEPGRQSRYRSLFNAAWAQGYAAVRGAVYGRHGLELVSPYFDRRIVEFMLAIPTTRINAPGRHRLLQYDTMKNVLPDRVCERTRKTNFSPLLALGLVEKEKRKVESVHNQSLAVSQGWVSQNWLDDILRNASTSDDHAIMGLSMCSHLELWLKSVEEAIDGGQAFSSPYIFHPKI
jgi:asparagine synthase (glutamine-hydrolysing)